MRKKSRRAMPFLQGEQLLLRLVCFLIAVLVISQILLFHMKIRPYFSLVDMLEGSTISVDSSDSAQNTP